MTLRKSRFVPLLVAFVALGGAMLGAACSGQGEGERCSTLSDNNGDSDCAGDLRCVAAGQLNGSSSDRCCPQDRSQATTPVCAVQTAVGIDAGGPVDSGGTTDTGAGEGGDAAKDSASTDTGTTTDSGAADAPADG